MRFTVLLLVATSCIPGPGEREVSLETFSKLDIIASEQFLKIVLDDGRGSPRSGPCSRAEAKLSGQLNGMPLPVIHRGGKIGESPGDDVSDNDCEAPLLQLDMAPPDGASTLEIADSSTTLTCNLPDLKAVRQATLMMPQSDTWTLHSGQPVEVRWSPSGDLQLLGLFTIDLLHVTAEKVIDDWIDVRKVAVDGDLIHFTVPSVSPGSYILELRPYPSVTCRGPRVAAKLSSTFTHFTTGQHITIVP